MRQTFSQLFRTTKASTEIAAAAAQESPTAMIVVETKTGRLVWANGAAQSLFSRLGSEAYAQLAEPLMDGRPPAPLDIEVKNNQGVGTPIHLSGMTLQGEHEGMLLIFIEDRSEQRADRFASIGQLLGSLAHEINNPLGAIMLHRDLAMSVAEEIADPEAKGEILESLTVIADSVEHLKRMIADLRKITVTLQSRSQIALEEFLRREIDKISKKAGTGEVTFKVEADPRAPGFSGDPRLIEQLLGILVSNATEAVKGALDKTVVARIKRQEENVICEIEDHGSGIAEANRGRVFDPFFTTKRAGKGIGLSLCIAQSIVRAHSGQISFETAPNKTVFRISIPAAGAGAGAA